MPSSVILPYADSTHTVSMISTTAKSLYYDYAEFNLSLSQIDNAESIEINNTSTSIDLVYRLIGEPPTNTVGHILLPGETLIILGRSAIQNFSMIAASATIRLFIALHSSKINTVIEPDVIFLDRHEFCEDDAAPMSSLYDDVTIVDVEGDKLSVSGGVMNVDAQATPVWGDLGFYSNKAYTRKNGLAVFYKLNWTATGTYIAWATNQDVDWLSFYQTGPYLVINQLHFTFGKIYDLSASTDYIIACILRDAGVFIYLKEADGDWQLLWVDDVNTAATLYYGLTNLAGALALDYTRPVQLTPEQVEPGVEMSGALAVGNGSVSGTDPAFSDGDVLFYFTLVSQPTAGSIQIDFRYKDVSNFWRIEITASGDIKLIEKDGGTLFPRIDEVGVAFNGATFFCVARGYYIEFFHDDLSVGSYPSAIKLSRETDWTVTSLGTGGAISDLSQWKANASSEAGLGAESVVNGGFDTDLTGWSALNAPPTVEWFSGRAHVITDTSNQAIQQTLSGIVENIVYLVAYDYEVVSGSVRQGFGGANPPLPVSGNTFTGSGTGELYVIGGSNPSPILRFVNGVAASEFYIDNASVKEALSVPDELGKELNAASVNYTC